MITTNRPVGAWGENLDDTTVAAAMLDRLLHRSVVITLDGASYRLRHHHAPVDELLRVTTGADLTTRPGGLRRATRGKSLSAVTPLVQRS